MLLFLALAVVAIIVGAEGDWPTISGIGIGLLIATAVLHFI